MTRWLKDSITYMGWALVILLIAAAVMLGRAMR